MAVRAKSLGLLQRGVRLGALGPAQFQRVALGLQPGAVHLKLGFRLRQRPRRLSQRLIGQAAPVAQLGFLARGRRQRLARGVVGVGRRRATRLDPAQRFGQRPQPVALLQPEDGASSARTR
jgi:hypothetical protein